MLPDHIAASAGAAINVTAIATTVQAQTTAPPPTATPASPDAGAQAA